MSTKTTIPEAKSKLRHAIEKKLFDFVNQKIKEQVIDFTVLYLRRNNVPHNPEELDGILNVFRLAVEDSFFKNVDNLMNSVEPDLNAFAEGIDPLNTTDSTLKAK